MIDGPYFVLTVMGAVGCGLVAGVFIGFSTFVMKGLAALPPAQGIAAMQAINVAAVKPAFMAVFLGATGLSAVLAVVTFVVWPDEGTVELLLGCALYLFGCFGVTIAANVPRNDALAKVDPASERGAEYWRTYVSEWTMWNHIRTGAAIAATVSLILGLT
ncbi:anthrone oxygenase family protein [Streptomyces lasiicapitis]|uniref:Membrane protein n=1 Tax=Streptomyces lasiicapitis TaxID=1923961 RepID=A0ABQ2MHQ5_9ACTN|nr:anthrone oxygenase family protein [Streptomyces lasiicapitis]GGO50245.1 membrane protein [Streptomyces lasiicapitis]